MGDIARYPGCTLEYCYKCGTATGFAGPGEDSLFMDDGEGPFCTECYETASNSDPTIDLKQNVISE